MDIVAKAWSRGSSLDSPEANPATHRTMKTVRPTLMTGGNSVHYLWPVTSPSDRQISGYLSTLSAVAQRIFTLGWGVDMVVGYAALLSAEQADLLSGERWFPGRFDVGSGLRVAREGTLGALTARHEQFLNRLDAAGFTAPAPLTVYRTVEYQRTADQCFRSIAAFSLLKTDASGFQPFDTTRRALTVAGMLKFAAKSAALKNEWPEQSFVVGHAEPHGAEPVSVGPRRFAYLPLPSIEGRGPGNAKIVGSIRRAIVTTFADDCEREIAWAGRSLSGQPLIEKLPDDSTQERALLSQIPTNEKVVRLYTMAASAWATVTPAVLPGFDDPAHFRRRLKQGVSAQEQGKLLEQLDDRIEGLLRKAILQAGFSETLAAHAEIEWRKVGFWPGTELADRYGVPDHLKRFPRFHVRIHWRDGQDQPVTLPGPICIGGGRFYGLGLFAAL